MKARWILSTLLLGGLLFAQSSSASSNTAADPRQQLDAFCSTHAADCAQLKTLHEAAHQACANGQVQSTACRQARDSVRAQMQKLESLGLPRPPGPPPGEGGHPPEDGEPPANSR